MPEKQNPEAVAPQSKKKGKRAYPETDLVHRPLIQWINTQPWCDSVTHIANERKCSQAQGQFLKSLGVKAGVSDLFIAVPSKRFSGYWLELKAPGKKPTSTQFAWLSLMRKRGYAADWFSDWLKAKDSILEYMKGVSV